jgi:hypothetical protein
MNEQNFGYRIKRALNDGLSLETAVEKRLKMAREAALGCQRVQEPSLLWAWAPQVAGPARKPHLLLSAVLLPALLLALGLFVVNYWHSAQTAQEIVEIDAAVLMGELPIDAYLDTGFDAWLKRSSD